MNTPPPSSFKPMQPLATVPLSLPILLLGASCFVYAVACGCVTGFGVANAQRVVEATGEGAVEFQQTREEILSGFESNRMEGASGARDRAAVKEEMDQIRALDKHDAMYKGAKAFSDSSASPLVFYVGGMDAFLKFAYMVLAVVFLSRMRFLRIFVLALTLLHITVAVTFLWLFQEATAAGVEAAEPSYELAAREAEIHLEPGMLHAWQAKVSWGFAIASLAFPVILLLLFIRKSGFGAQFANPPQPKIAEVVSPPSD